jgi:hypothetical protein
MKKVSNLAIVAMVALMTIGCHKGIKDDIRELQQEQAELEQEQAAQAARLAQLEAANADINALQGVVAALQTRDYVTSVTDVATPAPGGYAIAFASGKVITILHGRQGEAGATPQISVQVEAGVYYWTLNGEFITVAGDKLPVTGGKGADGTAGASTRRLLGNLLRQRVYLYRAGQSHRRRS